MSEKINDLAGKASILENQSALINLGGEDLSQSAVDDYSDIKLSSAAMNRLARTLISAKAGLVSMAPLICRGPSGCPFFARCPIYMEDGIGGTYPLDRQCIVELNFARDRFADYIQEFDVADAVKTSPTLRSQVSKLAEFDLYEYRVNLVLAGISGDSTGNLLLQQAVGQDKTGEPIEQLQEHPAWRIKERIQKQRMELLDAMGATIKRRVAIEVATKKVDSENLLSKQRELLERIDSLVEAMNDQDD